MHELSVFIAGSYAGSLRQDDAGAHSFSYDTAYDGPPSGIDASLPRPLAARPNE